MTAPRRNRLLALGPWLAVVLWGPLRLWADNPLVLDQFTADPTARVFEGRLYVYPSHDIPARPGRGRPGWFCMEDYHVFSSENLLDWTDHGVIVRQQEVPWVDPNAYSMWAPDCVFKDGTYYFYFPSRTRDGHWGIGVATSRRPAGPFVPLPEPIPGVRGIDPCVFIDAAGRATLYYSLNKIYAAPLKDTMIELAGEPRVIEGLPQKGLIEGPFVFERNGLVYLTYPHVADRTERLEYATGPGPFGPFEYRGVIMDELPSGCWTNHPSVVQFGGQWILFYHDKDLSPAFDKNRSMRADTLVFNADGTLRKVRPTRRGVGVPPATRRIQVDRASETAEGVVIEFIEPLVPPMGWMAVLVEPGDWLRYDRVDFGDRPLTGVTVRAHAAADAELAVRLDAPDGPLVAQVRIGGPADWREIVAGLETQPAGLHDLVLVLTRGVGLQVDWVQFEASEASQ